MVECRLQRGCLKRVSRVRKMAMLHTVHADGFLKKVENRFSTFFSSTLSDFHLST